MTATFSADVSASHGALAPSDDALERRARRRVGLKLGFAVHALVFALVNGGLMAAAAASGGAHGRSAPIWGWALGLGIHGMVVLAGLLGDGWRQRLLRGEIERLRRQG